MTEPIRIVVDGKPVPWARTMGGVTKKLFTPAKVRSYQAVLKFYAQQAMNGRALFDGPVNLAVKAYMPIGTSWSKKRAQAAKDGAERPTCRPDLGNLVKGVEDALNVVVWRDDAQIVGYDGSGKWYSERPRLEIEVSEVG